MVMLFATIPVYESEEEKEKKKKEAIDFGSDIQGLAAYLNSQK